MYTLDFVEKLLVDNPTKRVYNTKIMENQLFTANLPRAVIEHGFPFEIDHRDWLISISDAAGSPPKVKDKFDEVFFFFFNDDTPPHDGVMEPRQAEMMADIIRKAREHNKNIWVHCTAGICRSGAVVELLKILGWTVVDDFSPRRLPNTHVFSLLRRQFPELSQSWDDKVEEEAGWRLHDWILLPDDKDDI